MQRHDIIVEGTAAQGATRATQLLYSEKEEAMEGLNTGSQILGQAQ